MIPTDIRYSYIVDQQPIGRLLFRRFCEVSHKYQRYNNFLDVLAKYAVIESSPLLALNLGARSTVPLVVDKIEMDERRSESAQEIYRRFLARDAEEAVEIVNESTVEQCKERLHEGSKDVFAACGEVVRGFLAGEPFKEFENSMYFHRYLQWKWLEG